MLTNTVDATVLVALIDYHLNRRTGVAPTPRYAYLGVPRTRMLEEQYGYINKFRYTTNNAATMRPFLTIFVPFRAAYAFLYTRFYIRCSFKGTLRYNISQGKHYKEAEKYVVYAKYIPQNGRSIPSFLSFLKG